jgi:hypothetical protein
MCPPSFLQHLQFTANMFGSAETATVALPAAYDHYEPYGKGKYHFVDNPA